ncbi:hypothetical protein MACH01_17580 [Thalassospira tepidiphila]|nr:hypothetical protein MACH01_17580 [Thalassospira tepidiphila]
MKASRALVSIACALAKLIDIAMTEPTMKAPATTRFRVFLNGTGGIKVMAF